MTVQQGTLSAVKFAALLFMMFVTASRASASIHSDTIFIRKTSVIRSHRISLYPDENQKVVFFSVRGKEGNVYQLYVFDTEGRLVRQAETRNKQTSVVRGIKKGAYFFEVLSDDKRIGSGQIAIR